MPGGRPPFYKTPEELQEKVDEYFYTLPEDEKVTITGLVLYLGFESRQSFYKYGDDKKFSYTIKKAHSRIENHYENLIQGNNVAGPIFALKNLQWKDKTESEVTIHTEQPLFPDVHPDEGN